MHKSTKLNDSLFGKPARRAVVVAMALAANLFWATMAAAQNSTAPAPAAPPFEDHWYTNPFYIIGGILLLALIPQILYQRRKRAAERDSHNRLRVVPSHDIGFGMKQAPAKKKGRLSKEEMSSLLKASASPSPGYDAESIPHRTESAAAAEPAPPVEHASAHPEETGVPVFVPPTATPPMETGPVITVEELSPAPAVSPIEDFIDDDDFLDALDQLQDPEVETRTLAVRVLGQFVSRNSVSALTFAAANDPESQVRAAAVASLGMVGHESVFPAVLTSCADPAPEVRLAAARTLSDLKFSRPEAYTRLIAEGDPETLRKAVAACQQTGMTARAFDRLASPDSRQSYEAFAILSLLVKAGETKPLFNAIAQHPAENIRLAAVKMLRTSGIPGIFEQMALMADQPALTPRVRAALMDDSKPRRRREPVVTGYSAPAPAPEPPVFTTNSDEVLPASHAEEPKPAPPPVFRDDPLDRF